MNPINPFGAPFPASNSPSADTLIRAAVPAASGGGGGGGGSGALAGAALAATGPYGAAIGAAAEALKGSGSAGPSTATGTFNNKFDNSNWTVATGSARATGGGAMSATTLLIIAGASLLGLVLWKKL